LEHIQYRKDCENVNDTIVITMTTKTILFMFQKQQNRYYG